MKTSGPFWCGGGPTGHSASAGAAASDAAAPSKVRRVTRAVVERSCCMAFPPPSRRRASRRLARIIGRRGNGCLCEPEGFGRFHLGVAAREADVLQQGVVEAGQLAALAKALPPDCG